MPTHIDTFTLKQKGLFQLGVQNLIRLEVLYVQSERCMSGQFLRRRSCQGLRGRDDFEKRPAEIPRERVPGLKEVLLCGEGEDATGLRQPPDLQTAFRLSLVHGEAGHFVARHLGAVDNASLQVH